MPHQPLLWSEDVGPVPRDAAVDPVIKTQAVEPWAPGEAFMKWLLGIRNLQREAARDGDTPED